MLKKPKLKSLSQLSIQLPNKLVINHLREDQLCPVNIIIVCAVMATISFESCQLNKALTHCLPVIDWQKDF